jgi:hypothetical protein
MTCGWSVHQHGSWNSKERQKQWPLIADKDMMSTARNALAPMARLSRLGGGAAGRLAAAPVGWIQGNAPVTFSGAIAGSHGKKGRLASPR